MSHPEPQFFRFGQVDRKGGVYVARSRIDDYPFPAPAGEYERLAERARRFDVWYPSKPLTCPYVEIGGSAAEWPPFFSFSCMDRRMLIRDDLINMIRDAGFAGFDCDPAVIEKVRSRKLAAIDQPTYHALVPLGWMSVSLRIYRRERTKESDQSFYEFDAPDRKDPRIQAIQKEYGRYEYREMPIIESWDGTDIFRTKNNPEAPLCCTRRFLDFIRKHDLKNLFFYPLDALGGHEHHLKDFRDKEWPPSSWYPRRQPIE